MVVLRPIQGGPAFLRLARSRGVLDVAEADGLNAVYVFVHEGLDEDALASIRELAEKAWSTHRVVFRTTVVESRSFARIEMADDEERPSPSPSMPKTG